jgi:hypothetical protein
MRTAPSSALHPLPAAAAGEVPAEAPPPGRRDGGRSIRPGLHSTYRAPLVVRLKPGPFARLSMLFNVR